MQIVNDKSFAASIRAARRADPDGREAARRIRLRRKNRRDRWLASLNFEGLEMRTVVQTGSLRLVRLPSGAVANYAVLNGARVLHTSNYCNDEDAFNEAMRRKLFPKGARLNLGDAGFVTAPST